MRRGLFKVATLENMIDISAPAHEVLDLVVDLRNEPQWNPQLLHVQMLTPDLLGWVQGFERRSVWVSARRSLRTLKSTIPIHGRP